MFDVIFAKKLQFAKKYMSALAVIRFPETLFWPQFPNNSLKFLKFRYAMGYSNTVNVVRLGGQGQEVACDITKIYASILILEVQIQVYICINI